MFNNAFYDYLINYKVSMLVDNEKSLWLFLRTKKLDIPDDVLGYCGLKNNDIKFDLGLHLLKCMEEFNRKNDIKQLKID